MAEGSLAGLRVLVAEDELLLAMDLCDILEEAGCIVIGPARTLASASDLADHTTGLSAALLDFNLAGDLSLPLVASLTAKGVPVILTTGYDESDLPDDLPVAKVCVKPLTSRMLLRNLAEVAARTTAR